MNETLIKIKNKQKIKKVQSIDDLNITFHNRSTCLLPYYSPNKLCKRKKSFSESKLNLLVNTPDKHPKYLKFFSTNINDKEIDISKNKYKIEIVVKTDSNNKNKANKSPINLKKPVKKNSNWKKLSNLIKSINFLKSMSAVDINSLSEIDKNLKQFEEKYKQNMDKSDSEEDNNEDDLLDDSYKELFNKNIFERENVIYEYKKNLINKEILNRSFKIIGTEDNKETIEKIKILFSQIVFDEESLKDKYSPNFFLNQRSQNGETLLYLSCKNGIYDIVEYLLSFGLNPHVLSKGERDKYESCLEVAVRWGYYNIVKLLLNNTNYTTEQIVECNKIEYISPKIVELLQNRFNSFKYSTKKNNIRSTVCCTIY